MRTVLGLGLLRRYLLLRDLTIVVEVSNSCNARCVWCWMYNSGRKGTGLMREEDFVRFVDTNLDLLRKNRIVPYHRGEALVHPRFLDMMEYAAARGCGLHSLDTNLGVRVDLDRLLALPCPLYVVNLGGTTKAGHERVMRRTSWDLVTENLREMYRLNAKYGREIRVKMNVTRHNVRQIEDLAGLVVSLGGRAQDVDIGKTGLAVPTLATIEEKEEFLREVASDEARPFLRFTYDMSREDFDIRAKAHGLCRYLMPTVKFDGRVTVCCHDQMDRLDLGNAFVTPLARILRSWRYRWKAALGLFRRLEFCRECN